MSMWTIFDAGVEVLEAAHRAVVEAHADADDEVGVVGGHVGVEHAVHAEPAVAQGVRLREAADAEEGRDDRDAGLFGELDEFLAGRRPR